MSLLAVIAQVAAENPGLYVYGPLGVMNGYFILRGEKIAATVVREIQEMKETILLDIVSRETAPDRVRDLAQEKLDAIQARRRK